MLQKLFCNITKVSVYYALMKDSVRLIKTQY